MGCTEGKAPTRATGPPEAQHELFAHSSHWHTFCTNHSMTHRTAREPTAGGSYLLCANRGDFCLPAHAIDTCRAYRCRRGYANEHEYTTTAAVARRGRSPSGRWSAFSRLGSWLSAPSGGAGKRARPLPGCDTSRDRIGARRDIRLLFRSYSYGRSRHLISLPVGRQPRSPARPGFTFSAAWAPWTFPDH